MTTDENGLTTFSGDVKNITDPWTDFDPSNPELQTGHFVPIKFPDEFAGKTVKLEGLSITSEVTLDDDCILVIRLEGVQNLKFTAEVEGVKYQFDLTGLVPIGEKAFESSKEDYGRFGKKENFVKDFSITWDNEKGTASGTILDHGDITGDKVKAGHHFPLPLTKWYDEVEKKVGIKNIRAGKEQDWILAVENTEKPVQVIYNELQVMNIDISNMTYEVLKTGQEAFDASKKDFGTFGKAEDMYEGDPQLNWEGTTCKVTGTLKKLDQSKYSGAWVDQGHYFGFALTQDFAGKTINFTGPSGNVKTVTDTDFVVLIKEDTKTTPTKIEINGKLIGQFDLSQVTLQE